ncbi:F-box/LRR-repeat protein 17 isoform X1 [Ranitomeya variabilis]|uniref:F-box/LRR-repeat protein 17 isoform X1 n=1 Tax=Ranitomeya variabilis TaxID=490064 RepID=UPI0040577B5C
MGSFFCKQRRGLTPARAQRRRKLQQRHQDCLLRAPCMLCFIVRERAVSEPVSPAAPPPAARDCAHQLLLNSWQERSCSVLSAGQSPEPDSLSTDMVCKRKNSGEQPSTPCKLPRCTPAGDQGHPSSGEPAQQLSTPCNLPLCTPVGDQGHPSSGEPAQQLSTPCNLPLCTPAGDQGHPSSEEPTLQPSTPCIVPVCTTAEDQGHPSSGESTQQPSTPCIVPMCTPAGNQGHPSSRESTQQPSTPCMVPMCTPAGNQGHPSSGQPTLQPSTPCKVPMCTPAGNQGHPSSRDPTEHPSTPCKLPVCTTAEDQGHPSSGEPTMHPGTPCKMPQNTAVGDKGHCSAKEPIEQPSTLCKMLRCTPAEDQGHPSIGEPAEHTGTPCKPLQSPPSSNYWVNPAVHTGDRGHPSTAGPTHQPALDLPLPCAEELSPGNPALGKDGMSPTEEPPQPGTAAQRHSRTPICCSAFSLGSCSQDQAQTHREADPDTHKVEEEPLHINQLPPSLLLKIFSHLSLNERCLCVSLVCKYWRDLCLDFQFWKQLDLSSRSQVKDDILERIASRFWNITELNISDCLNVTDAGVGMLAARCSGLVKYTAYRCKQLSDSSLISMATHCAALQKVHVGNQDRLTDEAIKELGSRCRDLRDIHFGQCYKISDEGMVLIAKGCPKLKKIYMQENKLVTDKSVEAFADHCAELEYVGFMGCSVTSRGVIRLTNLKNLSSLDLRHIDELGNETVMEIVKKCRNLTSLNLCLNRNIDDRCVEVIAKEGRSLKELYLVTCKITDHALIAIGRYSTTIETVDVGWCKEITDQGATLIAQSSKSIRYLGLMRCDQVNEATVEQLVQQYPHITFSTVLQDCKRTLERAYQMGWTPNASSVS